MRPSKQLGDSFSHFNVAVTSSRIHLVCGMMVSQGNFWVVGSMVAERVL